MATKMELKEVREAIEAGETVRGFLQEAKEYIDSANAFSWMDIVGLDLVGSLGKHYEISNAKGKIEEARAALPVFEKELTDISKYFELNLNLDGFLGVADLLFDGIAGLAVDFMVHKKINDTKKELANALWWMNEAMDELYGLEKALFDEKETGGE